MCKICNENPVYEFTNKRKLCKGCFVKYFHKKSLFILRKWDMVKHGDKVFYENKSDLKGVVLGSVLRILEEKGVIEIVKKKESANKIAVGDSIDENAYFVIERLINGSAKEVEKISPVEKLKSKNKIIIKPLYLFLDEEIMLYARIKKLKFKIKKEKSGKVEKFVDDLEKKHKHAEVKRAVINGYLELYGK